MRRRTKSDDRRLDLLSRETKATVARLADKLETAALFEMELRMWALDRLSRLDELPGRNTAAEKDRQIVEPFIGRIEINPVADTVGVYLVVDLESALLRGLKIAPLGGGQVA